MTSSFLLFVPIFLGSSRDGRPYAKLLILNKPGLYSYSEFALRLKLVNTERRAIKVGPLTFGQDVHWNLKTTEGLPIYLNKITAEYVGLRLQDLFTLPRGHCLETYAPWRTELKDSARVDILELRCTYLPNIVFTPVGSLKYLTQEISSNTVLLRIGPGFIEVLSSTRTYHPSFQEHRKSAVTHEKAISFFGEQVEPTKIRLT